MEFNAGLKAHEDGAADEALEHYTKAADDGNTRAMVNAATLLLQEHSRPAAAAALTLLEVRISIATRSYPSPNQNKPKR